jgi:MOSC domain-containing protein YiiM
MTARVEHLFIKPARRMPMRAAAEVQAVTGQGLEGDAAFGRSRRQILLLEGEVLDHFHLQPGQTRENVVVRGLRMADLALGSRLAIGPVILEVTGDCTPCKHMDELQPGLQEAIRGRRGILAWVVEGGRIRVGDLVSAAPDSQAADGKPADNVAPCPEGENRMDADFCQEPGVRKP